MQIGEVSRLTGFSKDTIRWYEKIGLIKLDPKSRGPNNYRVYDDRIVERLQHIKRIKSLGFTLTETEDLLILDDIDYLNCKTASEIIDPKLQLIEDKIQELMAMKARLSEAVKSCKGDCREVLLNT